MGRIFPVCVHLVSPSWWLGALCLALPEATFAAPTGAAMTEVDLIGVEGETNTGLGVEVAPRAVVSVVSEVTGEGADLALSQVEAGLALEKGWLSTEAVLAVAEGAVEVGLAVAELRLAGSEAAMVSAGFTLVAFGGRLDAPVGLDADEYGDLERPMITAPLLLEATHAGWNEWGAGLRLGVGDLEVTAFGARGYAPESTAWSAGPAFGARARYAVGEAITVGASGAALFDADVVLQLGLAEVDAEAELGGVRLRAEGLVQVGGEGGAVLGGYLTAHRAFGWVEVAARAEVVAQAGEVTPRLGATAGVVVWPEHLLVRAEYDTDLSRLEDRVQLQVVAAL